MASEPSQTTAANDDLTALQAELIAERRANTTMAGEIDRLRAEAAIARETIRRLMLNSLASRGYDFRSESDA